MEVSARTPLDDQSFGEQDSPDGASIRQAQKASRLRDQGAGVKLVDFQGVSFSEPKKKPDRANTGLIAMKATTIAICLIVFLVPGLLRTLVWGAPQCATTRRP